MCERPKLRAYILTCRSRRADLSKTVARLEATDWNDWPTIITDTAVGGDPKELMVANSLRLLEQASSDEPDYALFLEDDLDFNRHLRHNIENILLPLRPTLCSLYNPGVYATEVFDHYYVAHPDMVYGSQALLLSLEGVRQSMAYWDSIGGLQDIKISRIIASFGSPIYYTIPCLVQHLGNSSTWGGGFHQTDHFDKDFKV